ncbi:presenilins-associated rhomboid-like protein, mitochondrial isoform X2 [Ctenocephalides felis]|uniref:presenilins-associated rhomboid-like protein, mitochondrial isoform X2 n=1 Tax=Ctenocephalides felis TaxID=7515 RepID=UPI000E6E3E5B|nr:presenilins-associated rhomboid-like protein, mitochondrial isoform X2 [Ctenocephalides felis]
MALSKITSIRHLYICKQIHQQNFAKYKINYSIFNKSNFEIRCKSIRNFRRSRDGQTTKDNFQQVETPFQGVHVETGPVHYSTLIRPLGFTIAFTCASVVATSIWQYENLRSRVSNAVRNPVGWIQNKLQYPTHKAIGWRRDLNNWWKNLSDAEKLFIPICFLNVLVFGAWRVPQFQPAMVKYFCSNPASAICWPMFLSTFSHYSFFHLVANMYVLHSFSSGVISSLGKEEFLALYLTSGVVSSFASYILKVGSGQAGLSLGASGAIMGIIGYVCSQYPDTTLSIIFLPFLQFSAGAAIKGIMAMDLAGIIFGWKFFDHAAHLGGALTGIFWCYFGHQYIWQKRDPIVKYWHKLRNGELK